jgi:hypothetical protein
LLDEYERQASPEARFVRYVDKIAPKLTHLANRGAALRRIGMRRADMVEKHKAQGAQLTEEYPEQTIARALFEAACERCEANVGLEDDLEFDDDDAAMWEVTRDGADPLSTTSATTVCGYNDGDRGRIAMHFASDDDAGWENGNYDEFLCVRRCKPDPERDGVIARVRVQVKT